ncbi:MAG: hypothetical protein PWQ77_635 [Kosmotogales bacterium]|nr:hypothetical protein [Kosmotogales bacterium]
MAERDKIDESNNEDNNERYIKAIQSSINTAPIRNNSKIFISDLWVISSIPENMIISFLKAAEYDLPDEVNEIIDDSKKKDNVIYRKKK